MITQKIRSITIIGAGNVAHHLAQWFFSKGYLIDSVWNRSYSSAKELAEKINAKAVIQIDKISKTSDLYLLCVKDDALPEVIQKLTLPELKYKILAHTSGSTPITVFEHQFSNFGSLYPLQTFTKENRLDSAEIPFFITGSNDKTTEKLGFLVKDISPKCHVISDEQRMMIHLAAVFACNFSNHLYCIAQKLLADHRISFEILHPLIKETVEKAIENDPCMVQTGPAKRNDEKIIEKHLALLSESEDFKSIYSLLSKSILKNS